MNYKPSILGENPLFFGNTHVKNASEIYKSTVNVVAGRTYESRGAR